MHIGLYGGTFDPVHIAHLILAEQVLAECALDAIWFIPAAEPPHKLGRVISPGKHRLAMLELAIAGNARFRIDPIELERSGPSYTVDTLTQLTQQHPGVRWSLLMGADSVRDFSTWKDPERIVEMAEIIAVDRAQKEAPLADFRRRFGDRIRLATMTQCQIAAADIRRRVTQGQSIRYLVPRAVEVYIEQQGLYRPENGTS
jgi:nicotinate-nucleotide adenylyltransferase